MQRAELARRRVGGESKGGKWGGDIRNDRAGRRRPSRARSADGVAEKVCNRRGGALTGRSGAVRRAYGES